MTVTSYLTVDGEILAETRGGTDRDYVPDALGSVAALLDGSQSVTDAFSYWPYGEERERTGTTATPFSFVGALGYYDDGPSRTYVRARSYRPGLARWQTVDPLWPGEPAYSYAYGSPTTMVDRDGQAPQKGGGSPFVPPANQPCSFSPATQFGLRCAGASDCVANTSEYGNSFLRTGNKIDRCASCVSSAICDAIAGGNAFGITGAGMIFPGLTPELASATACQNNCMIQIWRDKNTPEWQDAKDKCRTSGQSSKACCLMSVRAEQNGYDRCAPKCFPPLGAIPYPIRIIFATKILNCCD